MLTNVAGSFGVSPSLLLRVLVKYSTLYSFTADEIFLLIKAFDIPDFLPPTKSRYRSDAVEAFCLTLARYRTAGDEHQLAKTFLRSQSAISEIVNWVTLYINDRWSHLLDFDHSRLLSHENLAEYAQAVQARAPVDGALHFVLGTLSPPHVSRKAFGVSWTAQFGELLVRVCGNDRLIMATSVAMHSSFKR